jgi:hypothetical protein
MKTLYESIFDIDKNIDDDSAIKLYTDWGPRTFSAKLGPADIYKLYLKPFKLKNLEAPDTNIKWKHYYVMRPWNKKAIEQIMEKIFVFILNQISWEDAIKVLIKNNPDIKNIEIDQPNEDVICLVFLNETNGKAFNMSFERL